jgi:hypothetical protein
VSELSRCRYAPHLGARGSLLNLCGRKALESLVQLPYRKSAMCGDHPVRAGSYGRGGLSAAARLPRL